MVPFPPLLKYHLNYPSLIILKKYYHFPIQLTNHFLQKLIIKYFTILALEKVYSLIPLSLIFDS